MDKAPDAFRTISEVADDLDVPQHVLRFWESRFAQIKPMKRGGGRRYYRPEDVDLLRGIRHLLYGEGYTIRGVQRILREQGGRFVQSVWRDGALQAERRAAHPADDDVHDDAPEVDENGDEQEASDGHAPGRQANEASLHALAHAGPARAAPVVHAAPEHPADGSAAPERTAPEVSLNGQSHAAPPPSRGLAPEDLLRLRAMLDALVECRRLLDAARDGA